MSLAKIMLTTQPLWTGAASAYPYSPVLKAKFTAKSRFGDEYEMFQTVGDKIMIPRACAPIGVQDMRVDGVPARFPNCKFEPRNDSQLRAVMAARGMLAEGQSFIFQAPTGSGKTAMSMPLIEAVGRMTLIVVPKEDLMDRWYEDLIKILGCKPSEVGIMRADNFSVSGKKVVLGMLQSLAKVNRYPNWIKQEIGFIIFDEVHRLAADQFMKVAGAFPAKRRMGLSATVERTDGREIAFMAHIGPIRVSIDVEQMVPQVLRIHTGWTCPRTRAGTKVPHSPAADAHIRRILFADRGRNALIAKGIKKSFEAGRRTVIFTDYIDHIHLLKDYAIQAGVPSHKIGLYIGQGVSKSDLDKALGLEVIFATYGKMAEGTNAPWLDTVVLAGPRSNVNQPVGRIRREYEDKKSPTVIDFVDDDSHVFKGYAKSRMTWYKSLGCEVTTGKL